MNKLIFQLAIVFLSLTGIFATQDPQFDQITNVTEQMQKWVGNDFNFEYFTGYVPVGSTASENYENTSLFFSMVSMVGETINGSKPDTPLIFWFNGGPGCSSQYGNWVEIGPIEVDSNLKPSMRENSWNKQGHLVFIDQPINAGFSYSESSDVSITSTEEAAKVFKVFLQEFYKRYPHLSQNPTYFFGESYAGHYIPEFASMVINQTDVEINLQGVGIGDAWLNPKEQMNSYGEFFYNAGLTSQAQREAQEKIQESAQANIDRKQYSEATKQFDEITNDTEQYGDLDIYNFFHYDIDGQEDQQTQDYFVQLLDGEQFRTMYNIPQVVPAFQNCNDTIYDSFSNDFTQSFQPQLEKLIESGMKVMIYNGQLDVIVNTGSAQDWINTLKWEHLQNWQYTQKKIWKYPNQKKNIIGNYQKYDNFVFANIFLAGHMVPSDQPEASFIMLQNYLDWQW